MKQNKFPRLCVGLNCGPGNLETILQAKGDSLYEVYGPCPRNIAPTGRMTGIDMDLKSLSTHVRLAHKYGVRYNVLMNGSCFGGVEFSASFRDTLVDFVKFLDDTGADSTTIMNPFIIDIVRKQSKNLEIIVSSFAEVIEPVKVKRLRARGADRVVLHQNVYRNFEMLQRIRESTDMDLEIIPNQGCVNQCENFISHINVVAHCSTASADELESWGDFDYPIKRCRIIRQSDPIEFLMSCFIRPEDLSLYEAMGFTLFKLAGRRSSTQWMLNVIDAYVHGNYEGNVFDLSAHIGENLKTCELPNKELDGWYQYMGSNSDCSAFRERAAEFCKRKAIESYFKHCHDKQKLQSL